MSREIRADYTSQLLFPRAVEEWVPADHPARYIREFVDAIDLNEAGFDMGTSDFGRPGYAPDLLLKVWIYGYTFKIRSCRELERACREHMSLIWLTGGYEPDHNTLWRFWSANELALRNIYKQTVRVAAKASLIGFLVHAVDGTKITARASTHTGWNRKMLDRDLARLDQRITELEKSIQDQHEPAAPGYSLPEELKAKGQLREKVRAALAELNSTGRQNLHRVDREAKVMENHGRKEYAYNAQNVVDEQSGLIVATDVTTDENDQHQLVPMLNAVKENLDAVADTTLADAGYDTAESFHKAAEAGYGVLVSPKIRASKIGPYHTSRFRFDAERDVVTCPRDEDLRFIGIRKHHEKPHPVRAYHCENTTCPVRSDCTKAADGRTVEIGPFHAEAHAQSERRNMPEQRELLRKRKQIVELPFAVLKEWQRYRRAGRHGLEKVKTEWALLCACFNIMRMRSIELVAAKSQ